MTTASDRQRARRDALLDALSSAEQEWGQKLEGSLVKESSFLRKIMDSRTGAGSATGKIRDRLADLTVDKINDFLVGTP